MRTVLEESAPEDGQQLRVLIGRADNLIERSKYGIKQAKAQDVAWEILGLHKKLRKRRIELMAELKASVGYEN